MSARKLCQAKKAVRPVRCAIYTRKSTDEGLDLEFTSLHAQREAALAFIASQKNQGWMALPQRYDDGGFSGGNLQRPAMKRLLADIQAGKVDCVIVYKVDRLSRSLLDFARLMEVFQRRQVAFVAVTQEFNTATSMGRLILHILLSFAQFERELISERTRDKMGAARRRGKWLGSLPLLGYDADRQRRRLVVNPQESQRVRAIFALYVKSGSLSATVQELGRRGWQNKQCTTRQGKLRGGRPFTKGTLQNLLTNVTYLGQVHYKGNVYPGEHEAIVPKRLFRRVQAFLKQNRRSRPHAGRSCLRGLLENLLHCAACNLPLRHTYSCKGNLRYRYYLCPQARRDGQHPCATGWIPAARIEQQVLQEIESYLSTETGLEEVWPKQDSQGQAALLKQIVQRVQYDPQSTELTIQMHADILRLHLLCHQREPAA